MAAVNTVADCYSLDESGQGIGGGSAAVAVVAAGAVLATVLEKHDENS